MNSMTEYKGILIPIGGNEDKGQHENNGLDFIEEGILSHIVNQSGGVDAKIVVIPTASSIPVEVGQNYLNAFQHLGCNNVEVLDIRDRQVAEDPNTLKTISKADCVMFSGGNQSNITKVIGGTTLHELLLNRFKNEEFVIAGTSAGAMAMATEMVAGGSSSEAMLKGAVKMKKGLGLIPQLIIDTHFIRRGRFGRLVEAVATHPKLIGIGLAEDTGLIIKNGNEFQVIGSGMVILFDPSSVTHNAHELLKPGTAMSISNLTTHILANGDRFKLDNRNITVLPIREAFV